MRREQILKICLNHVLTDEIEYKPKDTKSWQFAVSNYVDGETETGNYCLRFKNEEIANGFKTALDNSLSGKVEPVAQGTSIPAGTTSVSQQTVVKLKLPSDFFSYEKAEPCKGCRGCHSDDFVFTDIRDANFVKDVANPLPLRHPIHKPKIAKEKPKANQNQFLFGTKDAPTFNFTPSKSAETGSLFGAKTTSFGSSDGNAGNTSKPSIFGGASIFGGSSTSNDSTVTNGGSQTFTFATPVPKSDGKQCE